MNILFHDAISKTRTAASTRSPVHVCMYVRGGARTDVRVMREATALKEAGFVVTIVDIEPNHALPCEEEIAGMLVKHIKMPDWFIPTRFKPWFLVKMARMLLYSIFRLMQTPADIYHAHDDNALIACSIAARLRGKPLVYDAHELPLSNGAAPDLKLRLRWLHTLSARLLAFIIPSCTRIITVSPPIVKEICNRYHVQTVSLVRNIPPHAVVPTSDRLRQSLGIGPEVRIALYQGNLHFERGLAQLIRAAPFLEPNTLIVIMGKGPQEIVDQLEMLIVRQGVADRVKILPPVPYEELLAWTVSADVGLIIYSPDYSANIQMCLPNKLFEYLMVGLPVLSSELDAVVEVIKTHDVGKVVSSLTPQDIGQAINRMLTDTTALARMRHNALKLSQQEFCWEKESQVLVRLYRDIVEAQSIKKERAQTVKVCIHALKKSRTDYRLLREATALLEAGYIVTIVDIEDEATRPYEEVFQGIHLKHIFMPSWFVHTRFKPWFLVKLVMMIFLGTGQLLRTDADIYHADIEEALPACYIAARLRRKPFIFDSPELPLSDPHVIRWRHLHTLSSSLLTFILSRCAGAFTVSPPIAEVIRTSYHIPQVSLVRNIPPYQCITKSDRLRQYLGLGQKTRIALYQGNLQKNRGLDRLVRAAPFLEPDIVIVLMGEAHREVEAELRALITSEGVNHTVRILPPAPYEELLEWTTSADIGLIIYTPEYSLNVKWMLPNKFFEYLMAGLPVLASQLDAVGELISSYDIGRIVPSLAPSDVGAAINAMLADSATLACMRHNALEVAKHEFNWEKESENLVHFYQRILKDDKS